MTGGSRPSLFRWTLLTACATAGAAVAQPPVFDPSVIPAQQLGSPVPVLPPPNAVSDSPDRAPTGTTVPTGVTSTPGRGAAPVVDPPPPQVQLQVRTPSHLPVGKPVPYKVTAANTSQTKAKGVKVRIPWPEGAAALTKCDPPPDGQKGAIPPQGVKADELVWTLPSLNRGESKTFELEFQPAANSKQVSATAYVSFEYGARVDTVIDVPKVAVKKTAPPQVTAGELATVRVEVTNPGKVPVPNARLVESLPEDVEVRGADDAAKTGHGNQREWKLGGLAAGQTKTVTYQVLPRRGGEFKTVSSLDCETGVLEPTAAETTTKVLVPALGLKFTGPPTAAARGAATYTATVTNSGTLPLENVRLTVDIPADLTVVKVTNGCRTPKNDDRERVWVIPKLPAGESMEFRLGVEPGAGVSGRRTVKATVREGRGKLEDLTRDATTDFVGRADLTWKPSFDAARVAIGRQGTLTVTVTNNGSETDKGVRLKVAIPPEVQVQLDNGPMRAMLDGATLSFPPQALAPGKSVEFAVTYQGRTAGQARFALLLEGESLGDKPLSKDQTVEVGR